MYSHEFVILENFLFTQGKSGKFCAPPRLFFFLLGVFEVFWSFCSDSVVVCDEQLVISGLVFDGVSPLRPLRQGRQGEGLVEGNDRPILVAFNECR